MVTILLQDAPMCVAITCFNPAVSEWDPDTRLYIICFPACPALNRLNPAVVSLKRSFMLPGSCSSNEALYLSYPVNALFFSD